ncbi:MAG: LacI family DNA-binding transcriptional regulator [Firmicutes bacterium]|mgnify:CR=1 FL=1|nr:LacI family DNA-binding transcriptional regulator [Bacillota bacterium]
MATVKDIARRAGVSPSTVSLALNSTPENTRLAPHTYQKVWAAAEELNYRPSIAARRLRMGKNDKRRIGVVWPVEQAFSAIGEVLVYLDRLFEENSCSCIITVHPYQIEELGTTVSRLNGELLDGMLIFFPDNEDIRWLETHTVNAPYVVYGRQVEDRSYVRVENHEIGHLAARLLAGWKDKTIGVFTYEPILRGGHRILSTLKDDLKDNGITLRHYAVDRGPDMSSIAVSTEKMISEGLPDGIIYILGDQATLVSIYSLTGKGIRVPDDVQILHVGTFFEKLTLLMTPKLSAITCDSAGMLKECVSILCRHLAGDLTPQHQIYQPYYREGDTFRG